MKSEIEKEIDGRVRALHNEAVMQSERIEDEVGRYRPGHPTREH